MTARTLLGVALAAVGVLGVVSVVGVVIAAIVDPAAIHD
jgi:hypothetical protein